MRRPTSAVRWVVALAAVWVLAPRSAAAVDPFEIQVYDGAAQAPGECGFELHSNVVTAPPRESPAGARETRGETHLTLEPALGVLPFWELGAYLQTALGSDGAYRYAGAKLRSKIVTPPGWRPHLRLGVNAEVSWLPAAFDPDRIGGELRLIAAWQNERWLLAVNPILDFALTTAGLADGPAFEPAATVKRSLGAAPVAIGLEYYAGLGSFGAPLAWTKQEHRLFETVDVAWGSFDFNLGIGEGLTRVTDALIVKLIAGYSFTVFPGPSNRPPH